MHYVYSIFPSYLFRIRPYSMGLVTATLQLQVTTTIVNSYPGNNKMISHLDKKIRLRYYKRLTTSKSTIGSPALSLSHGTPPPNCVGHISYKSYERLFIVHRCQVSLTKPITSCVLVSSILSKHLQTADLETADISTTNSCQNWLNRLA